MYIVLHVYIMCLVESHCMLEELCILLRIATVFDASWHHPLYVKIHKQFVGLIVHVRTWYLVFGV